jgi:hypothetical protein
MAGNKKTTELAVVPNPLDGVVYLAKSGVDYQVTVGRANGLAYLDASVKLPVSSLPTHTHVIGEVTGLQAALDGKQAAGSYAAAVHTHTTSQITDLAGYTGFDARYYTEAEVTSFLAGKSDTTHNHNGVYALVSHTHSITDVTGLQVALDGKQAAGSYAAASHTHAAGDITSGVMAGARLGSNWGTIGANGAYFLGADGNYRLVDWASLTGVPATFTPSAHTHVATDISNSTVTGRAVLTAADQDAARDAIGVYVQQTDPGAVADGSLWIW